MYNNTYASLYYRYYGLNVCVILTNSYVEILTFKGDAFSRWGP